MICHGFKGGIGTSSRLVEGAGGATVGVLVQANHGRRERLRVNGIPVGERIPVTEIPDPYGRVPPGAGSIIAIVATDAALLPIQCERLAQRAGLGIARVGGVGEHSSGDLFLAFASGNRGLPSADVDADAPLTIPVQMLANNYITALFDAVVEATEEAIVNALCAAETLTGAGGATAYELPHERLQELASSS
jgi:D-aminopeptidase